MSGGGVPELELSPSTKAALLERRLRQAALGCTLHGHGPLNALLDLLDADDAGELDAEQVLASIVVTCRERLAVLDPESREALRERKLVRVLTVFERGVRWTAPR